MLTKYTGKIYFYLVIFIFVANLKGVSQNNYVDSLFVEVEKTNDIYQKIDNWLLIIQETIVDSTEFADFYIDTVIIESKKIDYVKGLVLALNYKGEASYYLGNYADELGYYLQAKEIAELADYKQGLINSYKNIGVYNIFEDNYIEAQRAYLFAIDLAVEIGDSESLFSSYLNIGVVFDYLGDYHKALEYQQLALQNALQRNDNEDIARSYINIATIHRALTNFDLAEEYLNKSLLLKQELNDVEGLSVCYNNLGNVYADKKDYDKALESYQKSLNIDRNLSDSIGVSVGLSNIGLIYEYKNNFDQALSYYFKSLEIKLDYDDLSGICESYKNIGNIYILQGDINDGFDFLLKSWKLALQLDDMTFKQQISQLLSQSYAKVGDFKNAYEYHVIFKNLTDSIFNENNIFEITKMETSFEYDRIIERKELEEKQKEALIQEDIKRRKIVTNSFLVGFLFMILIAFLSYRSYNIKRKAHKNELFQKLEIKQKNEELKQFNEELNTTLDLVSVQKNELIKQNEIVSNQKDEITKSITYASRIQTAILPPEKNLNAAFADYFVLYMPKSIVSGDFYWVEIMDNKVFWAVADCTGHGVPGAFMSMLSVSLLNEIVNTNPKINAAEILNLLRNQIKISLRQTGKRDEQKDGLDIALSIYDKKSAELNFAGAYNPLYVFRKNENINVDENFIIEVFDDKNSLIEISADKQPVSVHIKENNFTDRYISILPSDTLYAFSDGFADQFGGENKVKFMLPKFKKLLLEINDFKMSQKREYLEKTIVDWRDENSQIDDILVMGVNF
ncbi:MAG: tetratricopeptide repeat protein [Bacteroidales bacterium]|nr:tetratricopeptide repeat protein [Bacteroidales bacterium]